MKHKKRTGPQKPETQSDRQRHERHWHQRTGGHLLDLLVFQKVFGPLAQLTEGALHIP
jgi:hypothetical protein